MIQQSKHGWIKAVHPAKRPSEEQILGPILDHLIQTAESVLAASDAHLIESGWIERVIKYPHSDTQDWLHIAANNADPGSISARNLAFKALAEVLSVKLAWSDLQHAARSAANGSEILSLAEQLVRHVYLVTAHSSTIPLVDREPDLARGAKNLKRCQLNGSATKNLKEAGTPTNTRPGKPTMNGWSKSRAIKVRASDLRLPPLFRSNTICRIRRCNPSAKP